MASRKVAIIGLGPTGAFAARAAYDMGCDVKIYVHGPTTTPPGAFWLHWIPEGIVQDYTSEPITIVGKGKAQTYINRQWGVLASQYKITSSFPEEPVVEKGYNPQVVIPHLVPAECELLQVPYPLSDADIRDVARGFDVVFQTFTTEAHSQSQPPLVPYVAAAAFGKYVADGNVVVYNGTPDGIVVREAQLFGNHYLEFPKMVSPVMVSSQYDLTGYKTVVLKDLDPGTKPIHQSLYEKVQLVGRFARWDKRLLSHDAYKHVVKVLEAG